MIVGLIKCPNKIKYSYVILFFFDTVWFILNTSWAFVFRIPLKLNWLKLKQKNNFFGIHFLAIAIQTLF